LFIYTFSGFFCIPSILSTLSILSCCNLVFISHPVKLIFETPLGPPPALRFLFNFFFLLLFFVFFVVPCFLQISLLFFLFLFT